MLVKQRRAMDWRFHCSSYRRLLVVVRVCLAVEFLLVAGIALCMLTREQPRFYATSNAGGFAELRAFSKPEQARPTVVTGEWAYRQGIGF